MATYGANGLISSPDPGFHIVYDQNGYPHQEPDAAPMQDIRGTGRTGSSKAVNGVLIYARADGTYEDGNGQKTDDNGLYLEGPNSGTYIGAPPAPAPAPAEVFNTGASDVPTNPNVNANLDAVDTSPPPPPQRTPAATTTTARQRDPGADKILGSGDDPWNQLGAPWYVQDKDLAENRWLAPTPPPEPGAQAPVIHRDLIDNALAGLTGYENDFYAMSQDNTGLSVAEAQLEKSAKLAQLRASSELAHNQSGALAAARSSRNRGDRGLLERQAIGEQAYLGSEKQRNDVVQQAEYEGNLAILRATEFNADRDFRFKALEKASDLGLNVAALEVDLAKVNLESATNWINNEAKRLLQNDVLDSQEYQALLQFTTEHTAQLLGFTRDMAAIQFNYDKLGVDDQNEADALLMQKYGIDKQTMVALKKIKQDGKFRWDQVLTAFVGGAATGGTGALVNVLAGDDKKPAA